MKKLIVAVLLSLVPVSSFAAVTGRLVGKQVVTESITTPSGDLTLSANVKTSYDVLVGSITGYGYGLHDLNAANLTGTLPAIDGGSLLNVIHSTTTYSADGLTLQETDGVFSADGSSVTLRGNTFNGNDQLVLLNGSGELPVISGANLTNLPTQTKHSFLSVYTYTTSGVVIASTTFTGTMTLIKCTATPTEPAVGDSDVIRCGNGTNYLDVTVAAAATEAVQQTGSVAFTAGEGFGFLVTPGGSSEYSGSYNVVAELVE